MRRADPGFFENVDGKWLKVSLQGLPDGSITMWVKDGSEVANDERRERRERRESEHVSQHIKREDRMV